MHVLLLLIHFIVDSFIEHNYKCNSEKVVADHFILCQGPLITKGVRHVVGGKGKIFFG